ncbi:uncharacterized protein BX664DRAFT_323534 [Halteromyces radiatus]|uniref:uncharacterized protein n=1 Tax=Halteromyces radiatus TaxID=101107 RepID=UPI00221E6690|nr:uncharacterized protein BX664DRAFT_323534 [Halteromyces radiatus]KAI8096281.1 hypothetical protein BX664DRAFT_323534 [Halteromyces radiatus]
MLHHSYITSQRIVTYILSLFNLQPYRQEQAQQYESATPSIYLSSSSYYLNDSIVLVSSKLGQQSDPWAIHSWLKGLSKRILYQLVVDMLPGVYTTPSTLSTTQYDDDDDTKNRLSTVSLAYQPLTLMKQVLMIQQHARDIIHQLDHLRPSEQFAKANLTAHSLHQLVRLSTDTLRSHSILALLAIMTMVQELLDSSPAEVRRHVFYRSKWGRTVILEMASILKTFSSPTHFNILSSSTSSSLSSLHSIKKREERVRIRKWTQYMIASLNPPTMTNEQGWMLDWLQLICTSMARYDPHWKYRQEYQDVIHMAEEYL